MRKWCEGMVEKTKYVCTITRELGSLEVWYNSHLPFPVPATVSYSHDL